ncbi:MAG: nucleotidyltransferase family protein [Bacillota bacterium]|nr:nucleotidyltransferase family protein [Bacillota bacterium]
MVKFDEAVLAALCRRHGIQRLRVFGSAARGEDRPDSDLDLLVRFAETKSLIEIVRIERDLAEYFGQSVDLVTEGELSPYIRDEVLTQAAPLYGPRG